MTPGRKLEFGSCTATLPQTPYHLEVRLSRTSLPKMTQNTCISMESFFSIDCLGKKLATWWPTRGAYLDDSLVNAEISLFNIEPQINEIGITFDELNHIYDDPEFEQF